jgi:hypothetical protein
MQVRSKDRPQRRSPPLSSFLHRGLLQCRQRDPLPKTRSLGSSIEIWPELPGALRQPLRDSSTEGGGKENNFKCGRLSGEGQVHDDPHASPLNMTVVDPKHFCVLVSKVDVYPRSTGRLALFQVHHPSGQFGLFLKSLTLPYHGNNVSTGGRSDGSKSGSFITSNL